MQHMDLVAMAMPSNGAWGLMDLLMIFAMWAVMMVAMMVPMTRLIVKATGPSVLL
jgi:predicted metal-binding membrane protein